MNDQIPRNPTILALESAAGACSAAIWRDGAVAARQFAEMARGHAEHLIPMANTTLAESGVEYADLDAVAVTVGPGTYTGLRVGLAAAKGLALSLGRPLLGASTLAVVAAAARRGDAPPAARRGNGLAVAVALETKRRDVYFQIFADDLSPRDAPRAVAPEHAAADVAAAGPVLVAGDAAPRVVALAPPGTAATVDTETRFPDAAVVAELLATGRLAPLAPAPVYLRPPDVTPPPAASVKS